MPFLPAKDMRQEVAAFLIAEKRFEGDATWADQNDPHEDRCNWAVSVNGEVRSEVLVNAYPTKQRQPCFGIILLYAGSAVWRVDYGYSIGHTNPFIQDNSIESIIKGPHYHSWDDNKHLVTGRALPKHLPVARSLPNNIQSYDNCFRWFCSHVSISMSQIGPPVLPGRRALL